MKGFPVGFLLVLIAGAVVSGVQVALQSHEVRELHSEVQSQHRAQDDLLAEYSRLLLERSTLAAYQNVERLAETELAMGFPETVERLEP